MAKEKRISESLGATAGVITGLTKTPCSCSIRVNIKVFSVSRTYQRAGMMFQKVNRLIVGGDESTDRSE